MIRISNLVAATFAVAITFASYAHAATPVTVIAGASGQALTLTSAKQLVSAQLAANGQRNMRPGRAEFDDNGNVSVEIVSVQGLPVAHVLVHADNGMVTDARTGNKLGSKG